MIAGVGKTYRMLQEAHDLLDNGVDVNIGYVETHGRAGTEAVLAGLPVFPGVRYSIRVRNSRKWTLTLSSVSIRKSLLWTSWRTPM